MNDTKTIHDMLIQIEGGDNDMEVINQAAEKLLELADAEARISWADAEIGGLQKQRDTTEAKFLRLCKDMDARNEYVEELKRIIASQRATLEEIAKTSSS